LNIVASAPGKIVLSGEYAVLSGAPAICVAVDRRAVATLGDSSDGECHLETPGFSGDEPYRVVDALCSERPACRIVLDTRAFAANGAKLGLGSSAALTVALAAALTGSEDVFVDALHAHRALQDGRGSGVDVAAAVCGGLIRYDMTVAAAERLDWPEGLCMRTIWTGVPSSTGARLRRLADRASRPSRSALPLAASRVADAWGAGDARRILEEYRPYIGVLRQFSVDHDLGIFDAGHEELTDAALSDGLVYKPAGAGGGDIGVLLGTSEDELDAFLARRENLVHHVLACALDGAGVRLETT
jgi:phosphomevalonate kinase